MVCRVFQREASNFTIVTDQFSVGAFADSAHEYLLKQWLLTNRSEPKAENLCA